MKYPKQIIHRDSTQIGGCQGMGEGGRSNCLMGIGFSFRDENVLELDGGDGCQHCKCISTNKLFTLKWLCYIKFASNKKVGGRCPLFLHLKSVFQAFMHSLTIISLFITNIAHLDNMALEPSFVISFNIFPPSPEFSFKRGKILSSKLQEK